MVERSIGIKEILHNREELDALKLVSSLSNFHHNYLIKMEEKPLTTESWKQKKNGLGRIRILLSSVLLIFVTLEGVIASRVDYGIKGRTIKGQSQPSSAQGRRRALYLTNEDSFLDNFLGFTRKDPTARPTARPTTRPTARPCE
jgi:hypothetical protein